MVAVLLLITPLIPSVLAQRAESTASLLLRFDNEHDLSGKEQLLLAVTSQDAGAGPGLLRLAQSTTNTDSRWMAMRGMATLTTQLVLHFSRHPSRIPTDWFEPMQLEDWKRNAAWNQRNAGVPESGRGSRLSGGGGLGSFGCAR